MDPSSLRSTLPQVDLGRCIPATCSGRRRAFGVAFPNDGTAADKSYLAADGSRPPRVLFCDLALCAGAMANGVCLPVDGPQLAALCRRELRYEPMELGDAVRAWPGLAPLHGPVWAFIGLTRFTRSADVAHGVVARSYLATVRSGARYWEQHAPDSGRPSSPRPSCPILSGWSRCAASTTRPRCHHRLALARPRSAACDRRRPWGPWPDSAASPASGPEIGRVCRSPVLRPIRPGPAPLAASDPALQTAGTGCTPAVVCPQRPLAGAVRSPALCGNRSGDRGRCAPGRGCEPASDGLRPPSMAPPAPSGNAWRWWAVPAPPPAALGRAAGARSHGPAADGGA